MEPTDDRNSLDGLKDKLVRFYQWPAVYVFKFIVPAGQLARLVGLLEGLPYSTRESRSGKYVSVTAEVMMVSSDEVLAVYRRTAVVEGLISL